MSKNKLYKSRSIFKDIIINYISKPKNLLLIISLISIIIYFIHKINNEIKDTKKINTIVYVQHVKSKDYVKYDNIIEIHIVIINGKDEYHKSYFIPNSSLLIVSSIKDEFQSNNKSVYLKIYQKD